MVIITSSPWIFSSFGLKIGLQFVIVRATLLCADSTHPVGMAAVAAFDIDSDGPESHVVFIKKLVSGPSQEGWNLGYKIGCGLR